MAVTERIADGRRRFFPAPGRVSDVFLRDKRGHHDRALEAGRDYEIEDGGVSMRRVPAAGERVVILAGGPSREKNGNKSPAPPPVVTSSPNLAPQVAGQSVQPAVPADAPDAPTPLERAIAKATADGDLEMVKDLLTLAARDHCERRERTAEWQDEFARLTAVMRAAEDIEGITAAFAGIEQFLLGGTQ